MNNGLNLHKVQSLYEMEILEQTINKRKGGKLSKAFSALL